jgi:hypothetical protein
VSRLFVDQPCSSQEQECLSAPRLRGGAAGRLRASYAAARVDAAGVCERDRRPRASRPLRRPIPAPAASQLLIDQRTPGSARWEPGSGRRAVSAVERPTNTAEPAEEGPGYGRKAWRKGDSVALQPCGSGYVQSSAVSVGAAVGRAPGGALRRVIATDHAVLAMLPFCCSIFARASHVSARAAGSAGARTTPRCPARCPAPRGGPPRRAASG